MKTPLIAVYCLLGILCSSRQPEVSKISSGSSRQVIGVSSEHAYPLPHVPMGFSVVTPEDINKLCQAAVERSGRPTSEGHMFLEFKFGGLRQYVTLTLAPQLFAGFVPCVAIEEVDFIQEQWQVNVLDQDQIEQWAVATDGNGMVGNLWHRRLLEDRGAVLKEEFLAADEDGARAIVKNIMARFLTPLLSATAIMPCGKPKPGTMRMPMISRPSNIKSSRRDDQCWNTRFVAAGMSRSSILRGASV